MSVFKDFEKAVLKILLKNVFPDEEIEKIQDESTLADYEYTGSGYFLSVRHNVLPAQRHVCDEPIVIGESNDITAGFVIFLEREELIFECHIWGEKQVPEDFRDGIVKVTPVKIDSGEFTPLGPS